jgi:hypothetical protein
VTAADRAQEETDTLRAAARILERDAAALDDCEPTDAEFARLRRAAKVCDVASNCRNGELPEPTAAVVLAAVVKRLDDGWVAEVIPAYDRTDPATGRQLPPRLPGRVVPGEFAIAQWAKAALGSFEPMTPAEAQCLLDLRMA